MNLSKNSHKLFAEFFEECDLCDTLEFPKVQVYSRRGSKILTRILMVEGITFGRHIFVQPKNVWRDEKNKLRIHQKLMAHELVHVLQYQQQGFFGFLRKYVSDFWRLFKQKEKWNLKSWFESYRDLPHEIEARKVASEFINWIENSE